MKFTSEDLMKAMGLKIGDTIKLNGKTHTFTTKKDGTLICKNVLKQLIDQDFEITPRPKKLGELKCKEFTCETCPLRAINCENIVTSVEETLYQILGDFFPEYQDQEIYDLLKVRLDKEVVEENA